MGKMCWFIIVMKIRRANVKDYIQIIELYNGFVGEDRYSKRNNDSFATVLKQTNSFIFVAEEIDRLAGFITLSIRTVVRYPKPIAELDELYVKEDFRNKGIGQKLLQTVIEVAVQHNCYRVYIESHFTHKAAHELYERMGFTNYGFHFTKDL